MSNHLDDNQTRSISPRWVSVAEGLLVAGGFAAAVALCLDFVMPGAWKELGIAGAGATLRVVLTAAILLGIAALLLLLRLEKTKRRVADLEYLVSRDGLTGLYNRNAIFRRGRQELDRAYRTKQPLAVLFIDLDSFKAVNDTLGHAAGDAVLREVANRLQQGLRPYDALGRYGGDEFLVFLAGCEEKKAQAIAERLRLLVQEPLPVQGRKIRVTVSIGLSVIHDGAQRGEVQSWIRRADDALRGAKLGGRNRLEVSAEAEA